MLGLGLNIATAALNVTLGPELVTDGDFSSAINWTVGTNWNINTTLGILEATAGTGAYKVEQDINPTVGKTYRFTYIISLEEYAGGMGLLIGGCFALTSLNANAVGTYIFDVECTSISDFYLSKAAGGWIGSIPNVSVKEVL